MEDRVAVAVAPKRLMLAAMLQVQAQRDKASVAELLLIHWAVVAVAQVV
jgi:hypothetical protein